MRSRSAHFRNRKGELLWAVCLTLPPPTLGGVVAVCCLLLQSWAGLSALVKFDNSTQSPPTHANLSLVCSHVEHTTEVLLH